MSRVPQRLGAPVCPGLTPRPTGLSAPAGAFVPRRFSQLELNQRAVVYVIDPDKPSLSDSLEFQVSDALGNTGPSHR